MVTTKSKAKPKSQSNTNTPSRTKVKPKAAPDNQVNNHACKQANKQAGVLGGSGDHRMIALNKLNISPKNVRRIKASETDDAERHCQVVWVRTDFGSGAAIQAVSSVA